MSEVGARALTAVRPKVRTGGGSNLGKMLRAYRLMTEQSMREMATRIGISAATYCRIEQGHDVDGATLVKMLAWMMVRHA